MIDDSVRVAVVGAGHGGTTVAALLRQHGFGGPVTLVGAEPHPPYHRPPLSKSAGGALEPLRPEAFYAEQRIGLTLGATVRALDARESVLLLDDGSRLVSDVVVLALGARPRRLQVPGADLPGVHTLRTVDDARALTGELGPGRSLVVVGGGYIGLEIASTARRLGAEVTVVEVAERVLGRSAGAELADRLTARHRAQGTRILTGTAVAGLTPAPDGRVGAVVLDSGRSLPCDVVLVGIGAQPCDELARSAGLECDGGVLVDERGRTSAPGVWAVGDMTRRPLAGRSGRFRLESIPSAGEQAKQVVADLLGLPAPAPEVPWFWSDQFDLKLKIAGLVGLGETTVVRGDLDGGRFAVFHLDGAGRVVAVETVNSPGEFMAGKKWMAAGSVVRPDALADASAPLRESIVEGAT
ncbi:MULTISPECIES: NAD(P)/FAD-dependent oxidoreductase [Pseudonocardia]|uniref:Rhodocoxin reductase n=2 Tax=Pseudonocardia TaxID=1847 RepID=A0A1Y2N1F0_PSEAH|nr:MULTISPECIES: FAD-dependent oxidoreductase [Pseudonocardia]OSY40748.1 Rhodocoxin reductase [Pseudonocardia autotrophica]TDN71945.1 3-phenylpropionate/trans-cinnamate dioxygenase ferredoxin reductase subunit [Pseudonocardia autotrophica]BBG02632.1 ferredoxin reductase [Pseudonocardia autotrophica]GEC24691.1 ferredoxin reductase [Pseudonocardia saturnea]